MDLDLSAYPATKHGAKSMIQDITPRLINLWKSERKSLQTDDLIAIVDAHAGHIRVDSRTNVYNMIRRRNPDLDLLEYFTQQPSGSHGTVKIWALVGFSSGQLCLMPLNLAFS